MWELKNIILKNFWVKEEINTPFIDHLKSKKNDNTINKTHKMQPKIYLEEND